MTTLARAETIDRRITSGALPRDWPVVARGDWGTGDTCSVCEHVIATDQVQVWALFRDDERQEFHVQCFVGWWRAVSELARS